MSRKIARPTREYLAAMLLKRKPFMIDVRHAHAYMRPIYEGKPDIEDVVGFLHQNINPGLIGGIGRITGEMCVTTDSGKLIPTYYSIQEFFAYKEVETTKIDKLPANRVLCVFRKVDTKLAIGLVHKYIAEEAADKIDYWSDDA
ncbi:MAG: hypothetical protein MN733_10040, partial [Nitrososphaera sp.]|nr:hypothetical protein [Nitrososphaera sp.]